MFLPLSLLATPAEPLNLTGAALLGDAGPRPALSLLEFDVTLDGSPADPFDRDKVRIEATVTPPSGTPIVVEGFWMQACTATWVDGKEILTPSGDPGFRVRFRAAVQGTHAFVFRLVTPGHEVDFGPIEVEIGPSQAGAGGFIRRDAALPNRLSRSTGEPYDPYGVNVDWVGAGGSAEFDHYFAALEAAGLTWTRVWMTHFDGTALEWLAGMDNGSYCGLGCYNPKAATRVDRILELAEARGIAVQLVLAQHSQFQTTHWSSWDSNPWNAANGGPLVSSKEFFSRADVIAQFDRKVHYLVARWGHSPALLAWELFNEVDLIESYPKTEGRDWMRGRASLLHAIDPYGHAVTTSYGAPGMEGSDQDWAFEGFDLVQAHSYLPPYWQVFDLAAPFLNSFGKPAILAEFGIDYLGEANLADEAGVHIHNGNVLASMNGLAGGAMTWWWDNWIDPKGLWGMIGKSSAALRAAGLREWTGATAPPVVEGDDAVDARAATTVAGKVVWLHDRASDYEVGGAPWTPRTHAVRLVFAPDAACVSAEVTFLDTWTGEATGTASVAATPGQGIQLDPPAFPRDLLIRMDCKPMSAGDEAPDAGPEDTGSPDVLLPESVPEGASDLPIAFETVAEGNPASDSDDEEIPARPRTTGGGCSLRRTW